MSTRIFKEPVIFYMRLENPSGPGPWNNQWTVLIVMKSGKEFVFYNNPTEPDQLKLDLRLDIIGPDDAIPEEYADAAPNLNEPRTMFAIWKAEFPRDPPKDFRLFCSADQQDAFNEEIYPPDESAESALHDGE